MGSFEAAKKTICGIEIMHMIKNGQAEEIQSVLFDHYQIGTGVKLTKTDKETLEKWQSPTTNKKKVNALINAS